MPGLPGKCALKGLGRLDPRLSEQIIDQSGTRFFGRAVRCVTQADPILLMLLPAIGTNLLERFGKLMQTIQPVIPAEATERRNHLWKSRKTINMNMVIMLAKAMMSPQYSGAWAKKMRIPTIRGR